MTIRCGEMDSIIQLECLGQFVEHVVVVVGLVTHPNPFVLSKLINVCSVEAQVSITNSVRTSVYLHNLALGNRGVCDLRQEWHLAMNIPVD